MASGREAGHHFSRNTLVALCILAAAVMVCRGDSVTMKSGVVYRGMGPPDRDNTLVYIWNGLKRVVVRDSRIERVEANNAFRGERASSSCSRWWCTAD